MFSYQSNISPHKPFFLSVGTGFSGRMYVAGRRQLSDLICFLHKTSIKLETAQDPLNLKQITVVMGKNFKGLMLDTDFYSHP